MREKAERGGVLFDGAGVGVAGDADGRVVDAGRGRLADGERLDRLRVGGSGEEGGGDQRRCGDEPGERSFTHSARSI